MLGCWGVADHDGARSRSKKGPDPASHARTPLQLWTDTGGRMAATAKVPGLPGPPGYPDQVPWAGNGRTRHVLGRDTHERRARLHHPSHQHEHEHQHQHQQHPATSELSIYLGLPSIYQGRLLADCLYPQGHAAQPKSGTAQPSPSQTRQAQWQLPRRWLDFFLLLTRIRTPRSATAAPRSHPLPF